MKFGTIIRKYRKQAGLTQEQLGELVFKSAQVISNWERGYTTGINPDDISNLATVLKIPSGEFIDAQKVKNVIVGKPSFESIEPSPNIPSAIKSLFWDLPKKDFVPVIGTVKCGTGGLAYEYIDEYIAIDDSYRADETRGFRAVGDSMEPDIHDGDICLVHLQEDVPDGALAVVVICDSTEECEGTIKRIHKSDGTIVLQATNPAYPPRVFTGASANNVHIVGRVVEIRHKTV